MYLKKARGMMGGGAMIGGGRRMPVRVKGHRRHKRSCKKMGGRVRRGRGWFKNAAKKVWGGIKKGWKFANSEAGRNLIKGGIDAVKTLSAAGASRRLHRTRRIGRGMLNNSGANASGPLP